MSGPPGPLLDHPVWTTWPALGPPREAWIPALGPPLGSPNNTSGTTLGSLESWVILTPRDQNIRRNPGLFSSRGYKPGSKTEEPRPESGKSDKSDQECQKVTLFAGRNLTQVTESSPPLAWLGLFVTFAQELTGIRHFYSVPRWNSSRKCFSWPPDSQKVTKERERAESSLLSLSDQQQQPGPGLV